MNNEASARGLPVTLTGWAQFFRAEQDNFSWWSIRELVRIHMELHKQYGAEPNIALVEGERMLVAGLRRADIPNRFKDELSRTAGTLEESPTVLTPREVKLYLEREFIVTSSAVQLVQDQEGARALYLRITSPVLKPIEQIILKMVNRRLPPGVNIKGVTTKAGKGFAVVSPLFDLVLSSENYAFSGEPLVATWESISGAQEAEEAIAVAKALLGAGFTSTVLKTADATEREERYVKSVVAEPNLVDKTTTDAKGRPTGAIGDMLTMEDIRLAAHWWMEHSQLDTFTHLQHGGVPLTKGDVGLLENYLTDGPVKIGSRNVPAGSWVQAYRIYNDVLWADIKEGRINGWSIGAFHKVAMMDVPASEIKRV